ncbi:MAG: tRNA 2-thiouridine(34) synthase MnmA [Chitinophagales bacterium]
MAKVVVGLSGGVDSSVAAAKLLEEGHEVIGIFMKNWHDDSVTISDDCPWLEDSQDALLVAEKLGIPFQTIDFSKEYKERIVDYMFNEYEAGRTPNPDVLCNREVKFDIFLDFAQNLGADFVATGHYCRKRSKTDEKGETTFELIAGKDNNKDQSYFLCQINQEQLAHALFPIGEFEKHEVRAMAEKLDLTTAQKKDSQGLCFIGKVRLPDFLQQKLAKKEGEVIEIARDHAMFSKDWGYSPYEFDKPDGKVVGKHIGAHFYTIGQRRGLGIGGYETPLFVLGTNVEENIIFVGQGEDHPGLNRAKMSIPLSECHWVDPNEQLKEGETWKGKARIRYRQPLQEVTLRRKDDHITFDFDLAQRGISPGQFVAWYAEDVLVGSGVIQ